jgi:hypothetical protein
MIFPKFECPCGNCVIEVIDGTPTPNGTVWSIKCSNCGRGWAHYVSDKQEGIDTHGNPKPVRFDDNGKRL